MATPHDHNDSGLDLLDRLERPQRHADASQASDRSQERTEAQREPAESSMSQYQRDQQRTTRLAPIMDQRHGTTFTSGGLPVKRHTGASGNFQRSISASPETREYAVRAVPQTRQEWEDRQQLEAGDYSAEQVRQMQLQRTEQQLKIQQQQREAQRQQILKNEQDNQFLWEQRQQQTQQAKDTQSPASAAESHTEDSRRDEAHDTPNTFGYQYWHQPAASEFADIEFSDRQQSSSNSRHYSSNGSNVRGKRVMVAISDPSSIDAFDHALHTTRPEDTVILAHVMPQRRLAYNDIYRLQEDQRLVGQDLAKAVPLMETLLKQCNIHNRQCQPLIKTSIGRSKYSVAQTLLQEAELKRVDRIVIQDQRHPILDMGFGVTQVVRRNADTAAVDVVPRGDAGTGTHIEFMKRAAEDAWNNVPFSG